MRYPSEQDDGPSPVERCGWRRRPSLVATTVAACGDGARTTAARRGERPQGAGDHPGAHQGPADPQLHLVRVAPRPGAGSLRERGVQEGAAERDHQGQHRAERELARRDVHPVRRAQDRLRHRDPGLATHRRGRDERQHPRHHRLRQEEHRRQRLQPVPPGGLRPVPPGGDRQARRERQPVRTAAARRHLDDDLPQGPDRRQATADLGRDDLSRREVPGGQPWRQRAGLPPGQRLRRRGRHLQHGQRRLRRQPLGRQDAQDRRRPQRRRRPGGDGRPGQQDEAADRQGLRQLVHRRGERGGRPGQGMHRVPTGSPRAAACSTRSSRRSAPRGSRFSSKLGFATLPSQKTNLVPLGGMGMHVSAYSCRGEPGGGPELHEVVRAG